MAGAKQGSGGSRGGTGSVPPRPGNRPSAPARPSSRGARPSGSAGGRPAPKAAPRASARQVAQRRRQRNIYAAIGGSVAVIVAVAIIVTLQVAGSGGGAKTVSSAGTGTFALDPSLVSQVESVPLSGLVSAAAAADSTKTTLNVAPPQKLPPSNPLLSSGGKPEFVYMGGEYCPYCAAERWSMVMAFSKFGTFGNLLGTTSSATDTLPLTPTFSFYGATYSSPYINLLTDEMYKNTGESSGGYPVLQNPTSQEAALISKWDAPPYTSADEAGGIPFVYLAGRYVIVGPQYVASALSGLQWDTAEGLIVSGDNVTSKEAMAAAGYLVGDICAVTNGNPASVCSQVPKAIWGINTGSAKIKATSPPPETRPKPPTTKTTK